LSELAESTGIEARTIRSYIERGLLPGPDARGRGAAYSEEHLSRLHLISSLRRARPDVTLGEIRIFLQGLNPEQIRGLAAGSISAAARAISQSGNSEELENERVERHTSSSAAAGNVDDWQERAAKLTGAERAVSLLRGLTGPSAVVPSSRVEGWSRIVVTPDVELWVRAEFDSDQVAAFRELGALLRQLLQRTDVVAIRGDK
jgi:DNA-binding transcriptional MerR regulator